MKRAIALAALSVLALSLAACEGPVVNTRHPGTGYAPVELGAASAAGGVAVVALGNPFTAPVPDLSAKVAAAMPKSLSAGAKFRPAQEGAKPDFYRVVWLFDPPPALSARQLCAGQTTVQSDYTPAPGNPPPTATVEPTTRVRALAAFCREGAALTSTDGFGTATSPDDPRFAKLIEQISLVMFPLKPESTSNGARW